MKLFARKSVKEDTKPLTNKQKRTIDKAVKKTIKDYKKTLDLLAKT